MWKQSSWGKFPSTYQGLLARTERLRIAAMRARYESEVIKQSVGYAHPGKAWGILAQARAMQARADKLDTMADQNMRALADLREAMSPASSPEKASKINAVEAR